MGTGLEDFVYGSFVFVALGVLSTAVGVGYFCKFFNGPKDQRVENAK